MSSLSTTKTTSKRQSTQKNSKSYGSTSTLSSASINQFHSTLLNSNHFRRGGAISCGGGFIDEHNNNIQNQREPNEWNLGMAAALFATYFTVMAAKCALPSTYSLIIGKDSGLSHKSGAQAQQIMATILSVSTFSIAGGKVLLGPVIDKFGGVLCLKVALSLLSILLGVIATTSTFRVFAVSWVGVDFIFSSCWAASLNAIHQSFAEQYWAGQISTLAVAARAGNALSFLSFASVLQYSQARLTRRYERGGEAWRLVFCVSAIIQTLPIALLTLFGGKTIPISSDEDTQKLLQIGTKTSPITDRKIGNPSIKTTLQILRTETGTRCFWMHFISRSLLMLIASFLLFVPSYMSNCFGMTSAASARVGSVYALGCLLSVSLGSKWFSRLRKNSKICTIVGLLGALIVCCLLQMAHVSRTIVLSPLAGTISMFIWGLSFAIPFYIPASLYALRRGGRQSSATSK